MSRERFAKLDNRWEPRLCWFAFWCRDRQLLTLNICRETTLSAISKEPLSFATFFLIWWPALTRKLVFSNKLRVQRLLSLNIKKIWELLLWILTQAEHFLRLSKHLKFADLIKIAPHDWWHKILTFSVQNVSAGVKREKIQKAANKATQLQTQKTNHANLSEASWSLGIKLESKTINYVNLMIILWCCGSIKGAKQLSVGPSAELFMSCTWKYVTRWWIVVFEL